MFLYIIFGVVNSDSQLAIEAIPLCMLKIDVGKTVEHNKNYLLLLTQYYYLLDNATSFDPTLGSSSDQEQKIGDIKCTFHVLNFLFLA
jgi:hypothetical protein